MAEKSAVSVYFNTPADITLREWMKEDMQRKGIRSASAYVISLLAEEWIRQNTPQEEPREGRVLQKLDQILKKLDHMPVQTVTLHAIEPTTGNVQVVDTVVKKHIDVSGLGVSDEW